MDVRQGAPSNTNGSHKQRLLVGEGNPTLRGSLLAVLMGGWTESADAHPLYLQRAELLQDGMVLAQVKVKFIVRDAA